MDAIVDTAELAISRRIRAEREALGWSLADLAEHSGVSKAALSKIERAEASPTATNLVKIASAYGLTLAALIARSEAADDLIVRRADQQLWTDPATNYTRRQVFLSKRHPLEMVDVELPAGARVAFPAASYAHARHIVRIVEGELALYEGERRHLLSAGDCLGFGEPADIVYANETERACAYVVVLARM